MLFSHYQRLEPNCSSMTSGRQASFQRKRQSSHRPNLHKTSMQKRAPLPTWCLSDKGGGSMHTSWAMAEAVCRLSPVRRTTLKPISFRALTVARASGFGVSDTASTPASSPVRRTEGGTKCGRKGVGFIIQHAKHLDFLRCGVESVSHEKIKCFLDGKDLLPVSA